VVWVSGLIFAVSHSLLALQACKQWVYAHGLKEPRYRLLYSVFAIVATGVCAFYVHQLTDTALYQTGGIVWGAIGFGTVAGVDCGVLSPYYWPEHGGSPAVHGCVPNFEIRCLESVLMMLQCLSAVLPFFAPVQCNGALVNSNVCKS